MSLSDAQSQVAAFTSEHGPEAPVGARVLDLGFSVFSLANLTGVDLDAALVDTLDKYRRRMASTGTPGSGSHDSGETPTGG